MFIFGHDCEFYHSKIEKWTHPQKTYQLRKTKWAKLIYSPLVLREQKEKNKNKYFVPQFTLPAAGTTAAKRGSPGMVSNFQKPPRVYSLLR